VVVVVVVVVLDENKSVALFSGSFGIIGFKLT
jgi:hypothetical protein